MVLCSNSKLEEMLGFEFRIRGNVADVLGTETASSEVRYLDLFPTRIKKKPHPFVGDCKRHKELFQFFCVQLVLKIF